MNDIAAAVQYPAVQYPVQYPAVQYPHVQYADCGKGKQINNGKHHYNKCNHRKTKTMSQKNIPIFC